MTVTLDSRVLQVSRTLGEAPSASDPASLDETRPATLTVTAFDDYIGSSSTATNVTVTTSSAASFDELLGFYDQLALQVIVDDTTVGAAPASLTVQIAHSADGRSYAFKNTSPEVNTPTTLNVGNSTYMNFGYDGGAQPSLGYVRLVIVLTAATGPVRAHVRVTVTGNNVNERAFSQRMDQSLEAQQSASDRFVTAYGPGQTIATSSIPRLAQFINSLPTMNDLALDDQKRDARDVLDHPHDHTRDEVDSARWFMLWLPILRLKNKGWGAGPYVTVPKRFKIAFTARGQYALIEDDTMILWTSDPSYDTGAKQTGPKVGTGEPIGGYTIREGGGLYSASGVRKLALTLGKGD